MDGAYEFDSGADDAAALINIADRADSDERKLIKQRMATGARVKRANCYIVYLLEHFMCLGRSHDMDPRLATDFVKVRACSWHRCMYATHTLLCVRVCVCSCCLCTSQVVAEVALFMLRQAIADERVAIDSASGIPLDTEHLQTLYRRAIIIVNPDNPTAAVSASASGGASMMVRQLVSTPIAHIRDVLVQHGIHRAVCSVIAYASAGLERAAGDAMGSHPRHVLSLLESACSVGRWVLFDASEKVQDEFIAAFQAVDGGGGADETYTPYVNTSLDMLQTSASTLRLLCGAVGARKTLHMERPDMMGVYAQRAARGMPKGMQGAAGKAGLEEKEKARAAHLAERAAAAPGDAAAAAASGDGGAEGGGGDDEGYDDEDEGSDSSSVDAAYDAALSGGGAMGEYLMGFDEEVRARVRVYFNRLRIVPTLSGTMDDLARMDTCARAACRELTSLLQLVCENNYMRAKREMWCRGTERALSGRSALKGLVDTEAADAEPVDPAAAGVAEGDDKAKEGGEEAAAAAAAAAEQAAVGAGMLHDGGDEAAASVSVVKEVIALGDALLKQMLAGSRAYGLMYGSKRLFSTLCKSKQGDVATLTAVLRSLSEFVMSSEEVEAADVNPDEEREGTAAEAVQAAREKAIGASKQSRRRLNLAIWALVMQAFDYVVEEDALQDRFLELDVSRRATRQPWMAAVCGGLACAVCLRVAGVCVLEACERALRVGAEQRAEGRTALARARAGRARQPCRGAAVYGVQRDGGARGWRRCERRRWRRWRDGHGRR